MSIVMGSPTAPIGPYRNRNSYRQIKPLIRIGVGSPSMLKHTPRTNSPAEGEGFEPSALAKLRSSMYLIEQDHRRVKRRIAGCQASRD